MIPEIGLMVGFYIVTRSLSFLFRKNPNESIAVRIFAILTILITVLVIADLFLRSLPDTFSYSHLV